MLDRISTVQYTGGRSTPSTDLARERALQAQRQADTWQMDLHLCNSPSHKIQILLASARDHELQKLSHLLKQGCLSMGEHRKLRDDVRDAYAALAKESLQLLENTARRYSSNSSSSNGSSFSSSSSSSPGRKESDSPALSTSPSAVTAAPLPSTPSTPSSVDTSARERSLAVEGTYKQLVSMFSSLFPWSDTVLFDPSMCPPLFFQQQQQQHLVQQQRPPRGGGGPLPPPPPPAFGHSGLGVLRSFQQIQNIAMQKVRLMMSNKQNRLQSAEHALEQWRWQKRSSSAAACSSSSSSSLSEHNNDDDENEDDAGLLVHHHSPNNNHTDDEKDKSRRQQKKDGGGGGAITDDETDWRDHSTSVSPPNTTDPSTTTPPSVLW